MGDDAQAATLTAEDCVWLHGDSLSPADPALLANSEAPAVFVFDEEYLAGYGLTFKRLFFLYEAAQEALDGHPAGGELRRGRLTDEILAFVRERGARRLHVTLSDAPRFERARRVLAAALPVSLYEPPPFVAYQGQPKRFSHLWRAIEDEALSFTRGRTNEAP